MGDRVWESASILGAESGPRGLRESQSSTQVSVQDIRCTARHVLPVNLANHDISLHSFMLDTTMETFLSLETIKEEFSEEIESTSPLETFAGIIVSLFGPSNLCGEVFRACSS